MRPSSLPRRTQNERKTATIARLVDATIAALAEVGYARASVSEVCARAGLTQGALFRHFATRHDLVAKATEEIAARHVLRFSDSFAAPAAEVDAMALERVVRFAREVTRTDMHAAWREVMIAARTDGALRAAVREPLARYERALLEATWRFFGVEGERAEHVGAVVLSIMHAFDSEAVTVAIWPNAAIEEARVRWATKVLGDALRARAGDW